MWIVILGKIVKKIPLSAWIALGVLVAWVGSMLWAYHHGLQVKQDAWDASVERGKIAIEQLKERQVTVNMIVDTVVKDRVVTIKEKARVIEKEIPVFIPSYNDQLPSGFRLLHDAAATNSIPDRSRIADSPTVSVGDVASTVNRNYEQCHIWREQVVGWQSWYDKHRNLKPSQ